MFLMDNQSTMDNVSAYSRWLCSHCSISCLFGWDMGRLPGSDIRTALEVWVTVVGKRKYFLYLVISTSNGRIQY